MDHDIEVLAQAAARAFRPLAQCSGAIRAELLEHIADGLEALGEQLIDCAVAETALPAARIAGERGRTTLQLRLFATLARDDSWRSRREVPADPTRQPQPRPAIVSENRPIGPVLVFGASNFPLAFSVAGGDTASALAVGCPVLAKAHPAHPRTCDLVAGVIARAVAASGLPAGTFGLFHDDGHARGLVLVGHPAVRAAAFTGSRAGGMALWRAAMARPDPIPFFAEMGSVNPVFVSPDVQQNDGVRLAEGLYASMTLGVGQFCTQPGLIFVVHDGHGPDTFVDRLVARVQASAAGTMLTNTMAAAHATQCGERARSAGVHTLAHGAAAMDSRQAQTMLFSCSSDTFLAQPALQHEIFGPSSVLVHCASIADFLRCAEALEGQLTATLWCAAHEREPFADLLWALEQRVGRIVFNGFPTGVEVGAATVHGGPFPATTDARYTSVGVRAIERFLRPLAWQQP